MLAAHLGALFLQLLHHAPGREVLRLGQHLPVPLPQRHLRGMQGYSVITSSCQTSEAPGLFWRALAMINSRLTLMGTSFRGVILWPIGGQSIQPLGSSRPGGNSLA